jgi:hypothetical protein
VLEVLYEYRAALKQLFELEIQMKIPNRLLENAQPGSLLWRYQETQEQRYANAFFLCLLGYTSFAICLVYVVSKGLQNGVDARLFKTASITLVWPLCIALYGWLLARNLAEILKHIVYVVVLFMYWL